jgi:hypothetical protein
MIKYLRDLRHRYPQKQDYGSGDLSARFADVAYALTCPTAVFPGLVLHDDIFLIMAFPWVRCAGYHANPALYVSLL